jgi:hypothetical protein
MVHKIPDQGVPTTVFGLRYLGVAVDEAHGFRNVNKLYGAVRALRQQSDVLVAMTATPVQTRPSASAGTERCWM